MKILPKFALCLVFACAVVGPAEAKKKAELSSLELQQMQSHEVETSKSTAFSAVMTVLQDAGYRIGSADKDTGLITGTASTTSKVTWMPFVGFGRNKKTPVISAYVEDISPTVTRIRLNFVMTAIASNAYGSDSGEVPIIDPAVYQAAFEKIDQAIFVRQAMASGSSAPPPTASAPVAAPAPAPMATPVSNSGAPAPQGAVALTAEQSPTAAH